MTKDVAFRSSRQKLCERKMVKICVGSATGWRLRE